MAVSATRALVQLQEAGVIPVEVDPESINPFVADLVDAVDA